jgi:hypothetical protein
MLSNKYIKNKTIKIWGATMADPTEQEGQAMANSTDPALNSTQRKKTLPTKTIVEEVAKDKIDGGGR